MEVAVKKLRKPAIVYNNRRLFTNSSVWKFGSSKIVGVASVGDKNAFAGICTLSEYFPSSLFYFTLDFALHCSHLSVIGS